MSKNETRINDTPPYGTHNPYGFTFDDIERILLEFKRGTVHFDSGDDAIIAWIIREWRRKATERYALLSRLQAAHNGLRHYAEQDIGGVAREILRRDVAALTSTQEKT